MHVYSWSLLCAIVASGGALPAVASAQDSPIPLRLSLDEAVRLVQARNPQLAAVRAEIDLAESAVVGARQRPNPLFDLSSEGLAPSTVRESGLRGGQELVVRVEQEIETAGRRRLRTTLADKGVEAARESVLDAERRLVLVARRTFLQLLLARAEVDTAQASLAEIDRVIALNRLRLEQGEIAGAEMRRLEVERLRFVDDELSADLSLRNARTALLALMRADRLDMAIEPADTLAPFADRGGASPDPVALRARALSGRPDIEAARRERERSDADLRLQRAVRTPNVTAGIGYRRDFGAGGLVAGLTVPLPLFDRNAGELARARAERGRAEARLLALEGLVALEVQQAVNNLEVSRRRVDYIERQYLQSARESRDIVLAAYRAGAADLVDYLDAQRAFREAQRTYNRALFDLRVNLFELEAVSGGPGASPGAVGEDR